MDDGSGIEDLYVTLLAFFSNLFIHINISLNHVNGIVIRFCKIVRIERLPVWAAILVSYVRKERASGIQDDDL